jgi:hypothetical protein
MLPFFSSKKQCCVSSFLLFYTLGITRCAREPWGGRFKTIEKPACSVVATFLFCFFIYLGLLAALVNPRGGASKPSKSLLAPKSQPFFFAFFPLLKLAFPPF